MKEQMSAAGVVLLWSAILTFWIGIAVLIRRHAQRRAR